MAAQLGVSTDAVQKLGYVARVAGVPFESLQSAFRKLAKSGSSDLQATLLGLATTFETVTNPAQRLRIATERLGRGGAELIPILNKGRDAVKQLMEEADSLGTVMSEADIKATTGFHESTSRLSATLDGLRNAVILPLVPIMTKFVDLLQKGALAVQKLVKGTSEFTPVLKRFGIALGIVTAGWVAYYLAATIATIATLGEGVALQAVAVAAWEAIAPILVLTLQFLAWAAAIGVAYLAIDDLITFFENGDSLIGRALKKWLGPFETWQDALKLVWAKVKEEAIKVWDEITDVVTAKVNSLPGLKLLADVKYLITGEANNGNFFSGGAASPQTAAALNYTPGPTNYTPGPTNFTPATHVYVSIDGQQLDARTRTVVSEHHENANREAVSAAGS